MSSMDHLNTDPVKKRATVADYKRLTLAVTEKDVGRGHVPTPVAVNGGNIRLRRLLTVERLITPFLLLCDREVRRLDVHRIIWIRDLVKPELGTELPRPRELWNTG
jgi:hypothetical protein